MTAEASIETNGTSGNNGSSITIVLQIPEGKAFGGIDGFRASSWSIAITKLQPYFTKDGTVQVDVNAYSIKDGKQTSNIYVYYHVI